MGQQAQGVRGHDQLLLPRGDCALLLPGLLGHADGEDRQLLSAGWRIKPSEARMQRQPELGRKVECERERVGEGMIAIRCIMSASCDLLRFPACGIAKSGAPHCWARVSGERDGGEAVGIQLSTASRAAPQVVVSLVLNGDTLPR